MNNSLKHEINDAPKLTQYEIYKSPLTGLEVIKIGWSWPAFFFSWIWAFLKKLYFLGTGLLIFCFLLNIFYSLNWFSERTLMFAYLIIPFYFGASGNEYRRDDIKKRGYELIQTVAAGSHDGAMALYASTQETSNINQLNVEEQHIATKKCPYCAETIKIEAKVCRYCRRGI